MKRFLITIVAGASVLGFCASSASAGPISGIEASASVTEVSASATALRSAIRSSSALLKESAIRLVLPPTIRNAAAISVYVNARHCLGEFFSVDLRQVRDQSRLSFFVAFSGEVGTDNIPGVLSPNRINTSSVEDLMGQKFIAWGSGGAVTVGVTDNGVEVASARSTVFVAQTDPSTPPVHAGLGCLSTAQIRAVIRK